MESEMLRDFITTSGDCMHLGDAQPQFFQNEEIQKRHKCTKEHCLELINTRGTQVLACGGGAYQDLISDLQGIYSCSQNRGFGFTVKNFNKSTQEILNKNADRLEL